MLHIIDLQISADVIASTLLDLTDPPAGRARNTLLTPLSLEYETWRKEQRPMACISKLRGMPINHLQLFHCNVVLTTSALAASCSMFFQFGTDRLRNSIWIAGISPTLHWQNPWPFK